MFFTKKNQKMLRKKNVLLLIFTLNMHVQVSISSKSYAKDVCKEILQTVKYGVSYPKSEEEYNKRAKEKACENITQTCTESENFRLHYAVTHYKNDTVELCAPWKLIKGYCLQYNPSGPLIQEYLHHKADCRKFDKSPCVFHYNSYTSFMYFLCFEYFGKSEICPGSLLDIANMKEEITELQCNLNQVNEKHSYQQQQYQILKDKIFNLTKSNENKTKANIDNQNGTTVKNCNASDKFDIRNIIIAFLIVLVIILVLILIDLKLHCFTKLLTFIAPFNCEKGLEETKTDETITMLNKEEVTINSEDNKKGQENQITSLVENREVTQIAPTETQVPPTEANEACLPDSTDIEVYVSASDKDAENNRVW